MRFITGAKVIAGVIIGVTLSSSPARVDAQEIDCDGVEAGLQQNRDHLRVLVAGVSDHEHDVTQMRRNLGKVGMCHRR